MPDIRVTTVGRARASIKEQKALSVKRRKKSSVMLEYESYLMRLERGKAIEITLKDDDKFQTIRYRINNAAQALRIRNLRIHRAGNKVICYREPQMRGRRVAKEAIKAPQSSRASTPARAKKKAVGEVAPEPVLEAPAEPEPAVAPEAADVQPVAAEPQVEAEPTPVPRPVEEVSTLEFDEECEMPMVHGIKTCEARAQRYSREGFEAFGHQYVITKVEQLPLGEVQQKWFKQHGLFSPREFKEIWKQRHGGDFDPEQMVWVHQFQRGFAPPPVPAEELDVGDADPNARLDLD
jgi:hypothetical protein